MMCAEPRIGVVVLNWNLPYDTAECLRSLQKCAYANLKVIVVDNASTDNSLAYLREQFPTIELISAQRNRGYAAGNNQGLTRCLELGVDWVMLLNNDTVVAGDMLTSLVDGALCDDAIGIVAPAIYDYKQPDRLLYLGAKVERWAPMPRTLRRMPPGGQSFDVDIVAGTAMLIRAELLRKIGMLDEAYFMYYEDVDLCQRTRACGWRIRVIPRARAWHKVSRSTIDNVPTQRFLRARSRVFFYYQYHHGPARALTLGAMLLGDARQMLSDLARGRTSAVHASVRGLRIGWQSARQALARRD